MFEPPLSPLATLDLKPGAVMFELTNAQQELKERARALAESQFAARAAEIDRSEAYPWDNVAALTEAGFMGLTIPPAYGGPGLG